MGVDARFDGFQWTSLDGSFNNPSGADPADSLTKFTPSGSLDFMKIKLTVKDDLGFEGFEEKIIGFRGLIIWKEVIPR